MIFENQTILVTGGTGSMGKTFVRRVLSGEYGLPKKIIILSRDEAKQHYMRLEYINQQELIDQILDFRIGDIRRYADVVSALRGVDYVVNAAALKQVPSCEYFPEQALLTNCFGAQNIVRAIKENDFPVKKVVGVSTDKACKPVNVMGMTKALQEKIFVAANLNSQTSFVCVRYGNVLASRGSVIPLFHEQIRNGGPVTITDTDMTRFLLSLDSAVDTVMAAIHDAQPGDTFIPIVASSNMVNVAKAMIGTSGIEIRITGIRPGEKLHEAMISEEESFRTYRNKDHYVIQPMIPELMKNRVMRSRDLIGEFSSEHHVIDLQGTIDLLKRHDLIDTVAVRFNEIKEMIR